MLSATSMGRSEGVAGVTRSSEGLLGSGEKLNSCIAADGGLGMLEEEDWVGRTAAPLESSASNFCLELNFFLTEKDLPLTCGVCASVDDAAGGIFLSCFEFGLDSCACARTDAFRFAAGKRGEVNGAAEVDDACSGMEIYKMLGNNIIELWLLLQVLVGTL